MTRTSGRRSGRSGPRESSGRSSRSGPRESSKRGTQQSTSTGVIVGAVGAVVVLLGLVFLLGGSSGRSRRRPLPRPAARDGRISPEEARRLKKLAIKELRQGEALYRQAGAFGSPGYAGKIAQARGHLQTALDHFSTAQEVLRHDLQLQDASERCGKLLSACFKVPVHVR